MTAFVDEAIDVEEVGLEVSRHPPGSATHGWVSDVVWLFAMVADTAAIVTASARDVGGVAFGDVIGANASVVTIALGVGAWIVTIPFGRSIQRYAVGGLITGVLAAGLVWDGALGRTEGAILVVAYVVFVAAIWLSERRPPSLGRPASSTRRSTPRGGSDLAWVLAGLVALTLGSMVLVEGVRQIADIESTQTRLGLTVVGFATAFELGVLAFSASRHGVAEAVIAGVIATITKISAPAFGPYTPSRRFASSAVRPSVDVSINAVTAMAKAPQNVTRTAAATTGAPPAFATADGVDDEAGNAELAFLSLPVFLAEFTALAVKHIAGDTVAGFLGAEAGVDEAPIGLVVGVDHRRQVKRFGESAVLGDRCSERCWVAVAGEHADQLGASNAAGVERFGHAQHVGPVLTGRRSTGSRQLA